MNSIRSSASDPEHNMFTSGRTLADLSPDLAEAISHAVECYAAGDIDSADAVGGVIGGRLSAPPAPEEGDRPVTTSEWFRAVARHMIESAAVI
ncbi:hypothetical protein [Streptomyces sp. TR02-1]|uniref:hypothetical protein n=1 Tax=Streptomyces sp. TR02-1 TaxID=3385977 RepID=UPI00399FA38D